MSNSAPRASAQHSAGIQTLLDAEREASKIVDKAKEYRTKRVKQTREEAKKESENARKATEEKYRKYNGENTASNATLEKEALEEAEGEMKELKAEGEKNTAAAAGLLLEGIRDAQPTVPVFY
ncbi:related to VACUOLAR ATP SYNTHASE SUBUNIT G (VMA-10) [Cephalotrichum gorgonifer]|uniref:V-type proton ATPase subunit G n=1 Tax=Cephalotrichum gorgonifer TaxID=2041049 RepID=A0AAE8N869_9PEZI|nr:related to VACUOLAR ATP SYNTHASE SUBUNIT G (VMA-10) [Cephalotrichum gorgonifer]